MYDTILTVTNDHGPIIVEGNVTTQLVVTNVGPATIEVGVWEFWKGNKNSNAGINSDEPDLRLELRPGNQRIISGSFMRARIKDEHNSNDNNQFAAIGARMIIKNEIEFR